ncbi:unnamed protein product [Rodentolepis nana]|uniref:TLDc domain-containing protein n=1 Tax=Rodentolepis nana TaxID=102285 RepID=A0A0R3T5K7_RODNA|nr:unnamed protein product [Rodentolepis nana]
MWDCESPSIYGYGPNVTASTPSFHDSAIKPVINLGGETSCLQGSGEGYAGTANSLANFCTNITETDDTLKQVRGGGFLAEFEREDDEETKIGSAEGIGGGGCSCSTSGDISPLGDPGKGYLTVKGNHPMDSIANGNSSALWVSLIY